MFNRVDLVRFVDLGYQIFFCPFWGLGMWIHAIRVRMGHPRGFQTLNWPQASHYCESGTFYLIWGQIWKTSVPGFGWSLLWLGPVQVHEKICLEVSNPYSQPLVLGNVQKTAPKPPFRNRAAQPTRTTNVQFFFGPAGPDYPGRRIETIFGPSFCTKNQDKLR